DHRSYAGGDHRDGDRRVPTGDVPREGEVDAFLNAERLPAVVAVEVLAEGGGEAGLQSQARAGDSQVRHAARSRSHAGGPHLCPGPRGRLQTDEDDVEEDGAGEEDVELRIVIGGLPGVVWL